MFQAILNSEDSLCCSLQVFWNLLHNSAKYSYPDQTIKLTATSGNHGVQISITDEGMRL